MANGPMVYELTLRAFRVLVLLGKRASVFAVLSIVIGIFTPGIAVFPGPYLSSGSSRASFRQSHSGIAVVQNC